ncbi:MAG: patatin-like phospholipase family protein [Deltaproteobacteria bacterium]|nr:patatin-like phospholipase family protein [Deltaproteobacteria bacterium]MBK8714682.1 patatin-like phospholipase family protein [Deltaproteobacteria bacterium]
MPAPARREAPERAADFDAVLWSGGGCRCFWQAGFWSVVAPALALRPRTMVGASAGAAFACAAIADRLEAIVESFARRTARNPRNVYPANLVRRRPVFPHAQIYRGTILDLLDDEALARLHAGPELKILVTRPPTQRAVVPTLLLGFGAYKLDTAVRGAVHSSLARRLGFVGELVSVRSCGSVDEVADLVLQSSCIPPLLPLYRRGDGIVVDGAIVNDAMLDAVAGHDSTLVMLSRPYARLPEVPGRTYVAPSRKPPIAMWDYASPALIRPTFELGREDGERFVARHRRPS